MKVEEDGDLGQQVKSGLRWSLVNTVAGRASSFAAGVILARLLAPKDFGVYTVALVVITLLLSLNDVGVSTAIVRWQGDLDEIVPTGVTLIFLTSVVLYIGIYFAAPALTSALHEPAATGVVRLLSVGVMIDAIFAVPSVLMTRSLRQDRRTICDFATLIITVSITIVMAKGGYGAWSLVWGRLIGNLVGGILVVVLTRARIRPGFNKAAAKHLIAFGLPLMGLSLLEFAMLNTDNIVIGRVEGPTALGLYVLAFNLSGWPVNVLSDTVRRVSLVAFSRLRTDPTAVRDGLIRSVAVLVAVTVPVCGLLGLLAHPLIGLVYGPKWLAAAGALQWLAVLGGCRVFIELVSDYLIALGRPRTILLLQGVWVAALVPTLIVGAHLRGFVGVSVAHAGVAAIIMIPLFLLTLHRTGVRVRRLLRRTVRPLIAGAISLGVAAIVLGFLTSRFIELLVCGTLALAIYVLILYPVRSSLFGSDALPSAPAPGEV